MSDKKWIKKSEKNLEEIERATENFQIEKVYQSKLELSSLGVYGKKKIQMSITCGNDSRSKHQLTWSECVINAFYIVHKNKNQTN